MLFKISEYREPNLILPGWNISFHSVFSALRRFWTFSPSQTVSFKTVFFRFALGGIWSTHSSESGPYRFTNRKNCKKKIVSPVKHRSSKSANFCPLSSTVNSVEIFLIGENSCVPNVLQTIVHTAYKNRAHLRTHIDCIFLPKQHRKNYLERILS